MLISSLSCLLQAQLTATNPWAPQTVAEAIVAALAFGLAGMVLLLIGFKAFDWITPRIDVQRELTEHKNLAVAIVIAALFVGMAIVISKAIGA